MRLSRTVLLCVKAAAYYTQQQYPANAKSDAQEQQQQADVDLHGQFN